MNPLHDPSSPSTPCTSSPRELLKRILDGDPLRLAERCSQRLVERALLVDGRRALLRSAARIAHDFPGNFPRQAGAPPLERWVALEIDRALDELVEEQRCEERRADALGDSPSFAFYARLALQLGLEPANARRACIALHELPPETRRVVLAVELEGRTLSELAEEGSSGAHALGRVLRDARRTIARACRSVPARSSRSSRS